jgi:hypothetical protein
MLTPYAHISMTYQPPSPEAKHVHRIAEAKKRLELPRTRRAALARRLRLA